MRFCPEHARLVRALNSAAAAYANAVSEACAELRYSAHGCPEWQVFLERYRAEVAEARQALTTHLVRHSCVPEHFVALNRKSRPRR